MLDEGLVAALRSSELLLRAPGRRDVQQDSLPGEDLPARVAERHRLVPEPQRLSGARDGAVLRDERRSRFRRALVLDLHPRAIVGMHDAPPELRVAEPLLRGVAEDPLHLRGDVGHRVDGGVPRLGVHDGREPFHQRAVLLLGLVETELRHLLIGHVDHEAAEPRRVPSFVVHDVDEVADPDRGAVGAEEAVLHVVVVAARDRGAAEGDRGRAVVGVDVVAPELRVGDPILGAIAQDVLGPLAHERVAERLGLGLPDDGVQVGDEAPEALELV